MREIYNNKQRFAQIHIDKISNFLKLATNHLGNLQRFLNVQSIDINFFKALNITDPLDYLILQISVRNLDHLTTKAFEKRCSSQNIPNFQPFIEFINENHKTQELITKPSSPLMYKKKKTSLLCNGTESTTTKRQGFNSKVLNCVLCNDSHSVYACFKFKDMSEDARSNLVRNCHKWFRCLGSYLYKDCTSHGLFKICDNRNHHTFLHRSGSTYLNHNKGVSAKHFEKLDSTSIDTVPPVISLSTFLISTTNDK